MGNQRKTAHRISTVVEVNKQSFGKVIVAKLRTARPRVKVNYQLRKKG
jgi:hypothetical protein